MHGDDKLFEQLVQAGEEIESDSDKNVDEGIEQTITNAITADHLAFYVEELGVSEEVVLRAIVDNYENDLNDGADMGTLDDYVRDLGLEDVRDALPDPAVEEDPGLKRPEHLSMDTEESKTNEEGVDEAQAPFTKQEIEFTIGELQDKIGDASVDDFRDADSYQFAIAEWTDEIEKLEASLADAPEDAKFESESESEEVEQERPRGKAVFTSSISAEKQAEEYPDLDIAPPRDSNWFEFAAEHDFKMRELDDFAKKMGFDNWYDLDMSISPDSLEERDPDKFHKVGSEVAGDVEEDAHAESVEAEERSAGRWAEDVHHPLSKDSKQRYVDDAYDEGNTKRDLLDIANTRLGWAVAEQLKTILDNPTKEGIEDGELNSNAVRLIYDFLRSKPDRLSLEAKAAIEDWVEEGWGDPDVLESKTNEENKKVDTVSNDPSFERTVEKFSTQVEESNLEVAEKSFDAVLDIKGRGSEGIVCLGAGGDSQEWIDGIIEMWQEEGIFEGTAEEAFSEVFKLTSTGGRTDLVLVLSDSASLDMDKMAMWRLQFGDCSWISDFVDNYASQYGGEDYEAQSREEDEEREPGIDRFESRKSKYESKEVNEMALSGTKYTVRAQSFDRESGEPSGEQRDEVIDISSNVLFRDVKSLGDIEAAYERFWNDLNPKSKDIVKVHSVNPADADEAVTNETTIKEQSTLQKASDKELSDAMTALNKYQHLSSAVTKAMDAIQDEISSRGREEEKD